MIRQIDMSDIPGRATSWNALVEPDIGAFLDSGWPVGEIDTSKYKNAESARATYKTAIRRMGLSDKLHLFTRTGRLFILRREVTERDNHSGGQR